MGNQNIKDSLVEYMKGDVEKDDLLIEEIKEPKKVSPIIEPIIYPKLIKR